MKKRFIVEIDIPENTGDLCWDQDDTGLQAFHECIVSVLPRISLKDLASSLNETVAYKNFIQRQNDVRDSFTVIDPKPQ